MKDIIESNQSSWNIVAKYFNGIDALPSYGPFTQSEEELNLIGACDGKNVLEIGFGSGHSLLYMHNKGAAELWGVDFSIAQMAFARETLADIDATLYTAPMEQEIGLPKEYFDLVYSIYAIGWSNDLAKTFQLIYSYLKPGGEFVFSWEHPFYAQIKCQDHQFYLNGSYQQEGSIDMPTFKGEDAPMMVPKYKMATFVNELLKANFELVSLIESDIPKDMKNTDIPYSERYYSLHKANHFPTTFIIKVKKKE